MKSKFLNAISTSDSINLKSYIYEFPFMKSAPPFISPITVVQSYSLNLWHTISSVDVYQQNSFTNSSSWPSRPRSGVCCLRTLVQSRVDFFDCGRIWEVYKPGSVTLQPERLGGIKRTRKKQLGCDNDKPIFLLMHGQWILIPIRILHAFAPV